MLTTSASRPIGVTSATSTSGATLILLFGAARLSLKIVDMPIRYRERKYGTTNIVHRWRHGWLLLRMLVFASRRLKFV